jgi:MFS family permease
MSPHTFRLVLIVSCAHAMVHTFEHALPAAEQLIGQEFHADKDTMGALGTIWRLPFGFLAMAAGWLADRHGSKALLIVYLLGCSATAVFSAAAPSLTVLFCWMFVMGSFASIYHPAGLALISHETTASNRSQALGWHGIFGSLGIAAAPFLAALVFSTGRIGWRGYYVWLTLPATLIVILMSRLKVTSPVEAPATARPEATETALDRIPWREFLVLVVAGSMGGLIYSGFIHFLPRYLSQAGLRPEGWSDATYGSSLAAVVLVCGAFGQGISGRIARAEKLKPQLVTILLLNAPPLMWMALADGMWRFVAACLLAFVHFMHQPIYNSLIAHIIPRSRRSLGYGFSNMMTFGVGSVGPVIVGALSEQVAYGSLSALALLAAIVAMSLPVTNVAND